MGAGRTVAGESSLQDYSPLEEMSYSITPRVLFDPTSIPGCCLWLDAADTSTLTTSGANVTQWRDKSGNANHASNTANYPTLSNSAQNGRSVLSFNGASSQNLTLSTTSLPTGTTQCSFYFVCRATATSTRMIFSYGVNPAATNQTPQFYYTNGTLNVDTYGAGGLSDAINVQDSYTILSCTFTNSNVAWTNGTQFTGGSTAITLNTGTGYASIGLGLVGSTPSFPFTGQIAEIIIYNRPATTSQRQQLEGYLAWKWGIQSSLAGGHPYQTIPAYASQPFPLTQGPIAAVPTSLFTPNSIPYCSLWLDAADTTTITKSGTTVSAWRDKSGNSNHITTVGTITYSQTGPYVQTTGGTTYFTAPVDIRKSTTNNLTMFIVYKWLSYNSGANESLWGDDVGGGWNRVQLLSFPILTQYAYGLSFGSTSSNTVNIPSLNTPNTLLYCVQYSYNVSNGSYVFLNGTQQANFTEVAASPETSSTAIYFGQLGSSNYYSTSAFNEILIYRGTIDNVQRQQIEGYLAWKWGLQSQLPVNHLYYYSSPYVVTPQLSIALSNLLSPITISGLGLWLDAADSSTLSISGSNVTQWRDKSGNSRHFSQATSGSQPFLIESSLNSLPIIRFSNKFLSNSGFPLYNTTSSGFSFFTVFNTTNINTQTGLFTQAWNGQNYTESEIGFSYSTGPIYASNNYGSIGLHRGNGAVTETASNTIANNTTYVYGGVAGSSGVTPTSVVLTLNGTQVTSVDFNAGGSNGFYSPTQYPVYSNAVYIGARNDRGTINNYLAGDIAEVIFYPYALSTTQRQVIEGYLAWKWGLQNNLPANHPYKTITSYAAPPFPTITNIPRTLAPTVFSPLSLTPQLWLDASDRASIVFSSGNNVSTWNDKSGLLRHATATGTISNVTVFNGRYAMSFGGSFSTYFSGVAVNTGNTLTAFATATMNSASYPSARILSLATTGSTDFANTLYTAAIERFASGIDTYRNRTNLSGGSYTFGSPAVFCTQYDGTKNTFYTNGVQFTPVASTGNFGYSNYEVGGSTGEESLVNFNGYVGEVILFNASLSRLDRLAVEGYLAWKWGLQANLPASHPFKNFPPI